MAKLTYFIGLGLALTLAVSTEDLSFKHSRIGKTLKGQEVNETLFRYVKRGRLSSKQLIQRKVFPRHVVQMKAFTTPAVKLFTTKLHGNSTRKTTSGTTGELITKQEENRSQSTTLSLDKRLSSERKSVTADNPAKKLVKPRDDVSEDSSEEYPSMGLAPIKELNTTHYLKENLLIANSKEKNLPLNQAFLWRKLFHDQILYNRLSEKSQDLSIEWTPPQKWDVGITLPIHIMTDAISTTTINSKKDVLTTRTEEEKVTTYTLTPGKQLITGTPKEKQSSSKSLGERRSATTINSKKEDLTTCTEEEKVTTLTPGKQLITGTPEEKQSSSKSLGERRSATIINSKKEDLTTRTEEEKVTTLTPGKQLITRTSEENQSSSKSLGERRSATTINSKKEDLTTCTEEEQVTTLTPGKQLITGTPEEKQSSSKSLGERRSATIINSKKEDLTTCTEEEKVTTLTPGKQLITGTPEEKESSSKSLGDRRSAIRNNTTATLCSTNPTTQTKEEKVTTLTPKNFIKDKITIDNKETKSQGEASLTDPLADLFEEMENARREEFESLKTASSCCGWRGWWHGCGWGWGGCHGCGWHGCGWPWGWRHWGYPFWGWGHWGWW